ncbi:FMN-binding negative transcriptional regulator [Belnapia sp. T18]|uniref:FMN-binding negative transcriptional regulator n=1 Tax=Belnapia arida TaxID=2804533 RepID=A0ABS1UCP6_9PROT|nr:FMN-binding negative transcriptional regulator [Belnapia arida]MBL6082458.1 FMN-binding negative transcriptional regulator [Belnapia arida]
MYVHPAFHIDHDQAFRLLQDRAFGTLVVADPAARPAAVHLPFLAHRTAEQGFRVELHVARANRLHELISPEGQPALLTCQGPDAYISPDWYGTPNQVPTWTYVAVHLTGKLFVLPEQDGPAHLDRLSAKFENRLLPKHPWTADKMNVSRRAAMTRAVVTLDLIVPPDGIDAQSKLIQHKGSVEHQGAIAGLRARGDASSVAIAAMMEKSWAARDG